VFGGLNAAAAGMEAAQQRLDAVANDIANANTPGYRRQRLVFHDLLYVTDRRGAAAGIAVGSGAGVRSLGPSGTAGAVAQTGRNLDVAIEGPGFLQVRRPDGTQALTRVGALQVTADGSVRTLAGDELVPPLQIPPGTDGAKVAIGSDGTVTVAERRAGRLQIVDVAVPESLTPLGDGLFAPTAASGAPRAAAAARFTSGALESSGVDLAEAMVEMLEAQRSFQLAGRAVSTQDELLKIANGIKR
jgi:flagellar basal-body rod protein FlgG